MKSSIKKIKIKSCQLNDAKLEALNALLKEIPANEVVDSLDEISEFVLSHMDDKRWDPLFLNQMYYVLNKVRKQYLQIERVTKYDEAINTVNEN